MFVVNLHSIREKRVPPLVTDNPAKPGHLEVIQVVYLAQQPLLTESLLSEVKSEDVFPPVTARTGQGSPLNQSSTFRAEERKGTYKPLSDLR